MVRAYGAQSMIVPLRRVLVRRPDEAFGNADPKKWHYVARPDLEIAQQEHDRLVQVLEDAFVEVTYHQEHLPDHADTVFVHDPVLVTDEGAVILRMGKALRRGEEDAMVRVFQRLDIPILSRLRGNATAEGGDLLWIDPGTLAVGVGLRTNREGLRQLKIVLERLGVTVLPVELPRPGDPESCLHLMSLVSIVDHHLVVVDPELMPVGFALELSERGFEFVRVAPGESGTLGVNVLALAPGVCVMLEGNPVTKRRLEARGCRVQTFVGNELSLKAEGGPTCLTKPILRQV